MTTVIRTADLPQSALESKPLAPPSATPVEQPLTVHSRVDFATADRSVVSGTWECEEGLSRWEFLTRGEIIHVVAGSMTVHEDGGEPETVAAGDTAYFPVGWTGVWNVTERLRKVFVVFRA